MAGGDDLRKLLSPGPSLETEDDEASAAAVGEPAGTLGAPGGGGSGARERAVAAAAGLRPACSSRVAQDEDFVAGEEGEDGEADADEDSSGTESERATESGARGGGRPPACRRPPVVHGEH